MITEETRRMIWRKKPCIVSGENIYVTDNEPWEYYQPFDFYGKNEVKSLYLKFISLRSIEEITAFISQFGFLGLNNSVLISLLEEEYKLETINDIRYELNKMKSLVQIWEALSKSSFSEIEEIIEQFESNRTNEGRHTYKDMTDNALEHFRPILGKHELVQLSSLKLLAIKILLNEISISLSDVKPSIDYDYSAERFIPIWEPGNLLSAMYTMFYLDLIQGKMVRKCQNETCSDYFEIYGNDDRKIYCDKTCCSQQIQREYRRRKKAKRNQE